MRSQFASNFADVTVWINGKRNETQMPNAPNPALCEPAVHRQRTVFFGF